MQLKLEEMTLDQKLGMVLCARRFSEEDIEYILEMIKNRSLGCVQLPAWNRDVCDRILSAIDYPVLVINDTEMGFPTSDLPKIPLTSLAACNKKEYYQAFAKGIVHDAKKAGFNGTWGPVIDILFEDGPERVHRVFSNDPVKVSEAAEVIARIYRQNGYLSTGKHYPGAHDCPFDTHMTEGYSERTEEELMNFELVPYMHLHKKGLLPAIMTDHTVCRKIDPEHPASLSKKVIDIIRRMGFDGLCFTDSFAMMGILQKYGEENIYGMAIAAGNDLVLPNYNSSVKDCFERLKKNYLDGAFTEQRLNEAVRRVLAAQSFVSAPPEDPTVFTEKDRQLLYDVARDCVTAVTEEGVTAALPKDEKSRLFVILTGNQFDPEGSNERDDREIDVAPWYFPKRIADKIREVFPDAGIEYLPEFSNKADHIRILNVATHYQEVVFVTFCVTDCYLGTDGLTRRTESVMNALIHSEKVSAIVHFGNPFALKNLLPVSRKIFGYMIPESQIHAIDVLAGKLEAKGKLPFNID